MGLRELLEKFVVFDEANPGASTPERSKDAAPPGGPPPPPMRDFDLSDVYRQRGISPVPFAAERALELLTPLPKGLSAELQRQVLKEMLIGNSTSSTAVAEDARSKVDALTTAADNLSGEFADFMTTTEDEIAKLEAEIREKREAIEHAKVEGEQIIQLCRAEAERLKNLLQILG